MKTLKLDGKWVVRQDGSGKMIPARVPGDVYADLLRAKEIDDPFYRENESDLQWIGKTAWVYEREFNASAALLKEDRVLLQSDGLDTFSTVSVNGKKVASTDNMFREHEWDVKSLLTPGKNSISVRFDSVIPYTEQKQKQRPIACWGVGGMSAAHYGWVRKEQCNFGWDWGPSLVTCGIWRSMRIVGISTARLSDVRIDQAHKAGSVTLSVAVAAETRLRKSLSVRVTASFKGKVVAEKTVTLSGRK